MVRILLLALCALAALYLLKKFKRLDAGARRRVGREALFLIGAVVAVVVLARAGLYWLGAIAAGGWALLRGLAPFVMRVLPLLQRRREAGKRDADREPQSPADSASHAKAPRDADPAPRQLMTRAEALEVLGLQEGASREAIHSAYRSLMRKVHPDSPGGSNYLASKLNQAKDVLTS